MQRKDAPADGLLRTPSGAIEGGPDAAALPVAGLRYDVFLCHNRVEKPVVKDIAEALQVEAGILFCIS